MMIPTIHDVSLALYIAENWKKASRRRGGKPIASRAVPEERTPCNVAEPNPALERPASPKEVNGRLEAPKKRKKSRSGPKRHGKAA